MSIRSCHRVPVISTVPHVFRIRPSYALSAYTKDTNLQEANIGQFIGLAILSNIHYRLDVFVWAFVVWKYEGFAAQDCK